MLASIHTFNFKIPPAWGVNTSIKHRHTPANTSARRAVHRNYGNLQFVLWGIIFSASAGTHVHPFLSWGKGGISHLHPKSKKSWREPCIHFWWCLESYSLFLLIFVHFILWVVSASVWWRMVGSSSVHFSHLSHHFPCTTRRKFLGALRPLTPWTPPWPRWPLDPDLPG